MRGIAWLLVVSLLATALLAMPGAAQDPEPNVVLDGTEGPDCPTGKVTCFIEAEGSFDELYANRSFTITLRAAGNAPHNIHVTTSDNAPDGPVRDTSPDVAIAASETVEGGEETVLSFDVPADATELYFWCDVGTHESEGMWFTQSVSEPPPPPAEENSSDEEDDAAGNETDDGNMTGDDNSSMENDGANDSVNDTDDDLAAGEENDSPLGAFTALAGLALAVSLARRGGLNSRR